MYVVIRFELGSEQLFIIWIHLSSGDIHVSGHEGQYSQSDLKHQTFIQSDCFVNKPLSCMCTEACPVDLDRWPSFNFFTDRSILWICSGSGRSQWRWVSFIIYDLPHISEIKVPSLILHPNYS